MYIGIFLIICAAVLMFRVAQYEKRRGWLWGSLTALIIMLLSQVILSTYLPSLVGVILAYMIMMAANIYRPVNKGPI